MGCDSRQGQKDKIKKGWGGPHTARTNIRGGQRAGQSLQPQGEWQLHLPVRPPYPAPEGPVMLSAQVAFACSGSNQYSD